MPWRKHARYRIRKRRAMNDAMNDDHEWSQSISKFSETAVAIWPLSIHQIWSQSFELILIYSLANNFDTLHVAHTGCEASSPNWLGLINMNLNEWNHFWTLFSHVAHVHWKLSANKERDDRPGLVGSGWVGPCKNVLLIGDGLAQLLASLVLKRKFYWLQMS